MEWIGDYVAWLLDLGLVGIPLLVISALLAFVAVGLVLNGLVAAAQAFGRGWRQAGEARQAD